MSSTKDPKREQKMNCLSNPLRGFTTRSYWLLLYCVSKCGEKGGSFGQIDTELDKALECIRKIKKSWRLVWLLSIDPGCDFDTKDALHRICELGRAKTKILKSSPRGENNKYLYVITKAGGRVLGDQEVNLAPPGISL